MTFPAQLPHSAAFWHNWVCLKPVAHCWYEDARFTFLTLFEIRSQHLLCHNRCCLMPGCSRKPRPLNFGLGLCSAQPPKNGCHPRPGLARGAALPITGSVVMRPVEISFFRHSGQGRPEGASPLIRQLFIGLPGLGGSADYRMCRVWGVVVTSQPPANTVGGT